ncbi:MAG: fumarylacetoacetate hydrolase family protein [candidate division Zixibacteria bacterium]|nr:fumarylacetoacetate hydrolase family protein [candidate division Zixibacteria bacterium]MDH3935811.1 fumarylacetoacetate hydrolase family protein [candidate division Zixibacteria bacterium]MDH4035486.1 fumarylacetoacetate hydrolase family protein [candidate division Zixibacteria bacterium]
MPKRFVRFDNPESKSAEYGKIENDRVFALDPASGEPAGDADQGFALTDVKLLAPVEPSKIVCIGLNYHAHVAASQSADNAPKQPLIFLKPPSSVIGPGDAIVHTAQSERVDYEAELGVVVGRTAKNVSRRDADKFILGLTCVNDVTARDLQKKDGQWSRAKGFDTFCPVGPWIITGVDYSDVLVEGILNGEVMQSGRTSLMIFDIPYLISYVSSIMTLYPGDLISTGTPAGIAPMKPGDEIEVRIENVGSLTNPIAAPGAV